MPLCPLASWSALLPPFLLALQGNYLALRLQSTAPAKSGESPVLWLHWDQESPTSLPSPALFSEPQEGCVWGGGEGSVKAAVSLYVTQTSGHSRLDQTPVCPRPKKLSQSTPRLTQTQTSWIPRFEHRSKTSQPKFQNPHPKTWHSPILSV